MQSSSPWGQCWKDIGTWASGPGAGGQTLIALGDLHAWLGVKNSDDEGTRFDLRAQVYVNGDLVSSGLARCITVSCATQPMRKRWWPASPPSRLVRSRPHDVVSVKLSTRIGTNPHDSACGGHSSATGGVLVMKGSAVRVRASGFRSSSAQLGFRH